MKNKEQDKEFTDEEFQALRNFVKSELRAFGKSLPKQKPQDKPFNLSKKIFDCEDIGYDGDLLEAKDVREFIKQVLKESVNIDGTEYVAVEDILNKAGDKFK